MKRVTGIGGVFFRTRDPEAVKAWYVKHLGFKPEEDGGFIFKWRDHDKPDRVGCTVWSPFAEDTSYFGPGRPAYMVNLRVDNMAELLPRLRAEGVKVDETTEESEYGKFAWITDIEGNRIELWEPPAGS